MSTDPGGKTPMATRPRPRITAEEYLEAERHAETKHEYFSGEVFAMEGASRKHVLVVKNLVVALDRQLRGGPCDVYPSDMRVKVDPTGLYTYPDIAVVCGEPRLEDDNFDTLLNPVLLVEVLSPSTEDYDRGRKAEHYRRLESLQEYVLASQEEPLIQRQQRQSGGDWLLSDFRGLDTLVELASIGCVLELAEIYRNVLG